MDSFQELTSKVPHHGIDLWLQVQIFYDHVNPATSRTIDQAAGEKLRDKNAKVSWALLEDLALYDNESWNDPRNFAKPVKAISLPQDVMMNKITSSCEICSGPYDTQYCMENLEQAFVDYASSRTDEARGLADGTKSYPVGIVKNIEVYVGKLKLLEEAYVINMKKDPTCPLLVGRGFLAIASAIIDYTPYWTTLAKWKSYKSRPSTNYIGARPSYYLERDFINDHLPEELEIARDTELNPFKDVIVFKKMVEFLGAIPINLKGNMWESEDLIDKKIDWKRPSKEGDGVWYIKIEMIDLDGENFDRIFKSIPTN
ncbi:hypothetical protein Tco_1181303 [Tanacetum coccineum]